MTDGSKLRGLGLIAFCAFALGCVRQGAEARCADATGACGDTPGDPTGNWAVMGACTFHADQPYRPMSLTEQVQEPQSPSVTPLQPQPTTDGNWCSDLIVAPPDNKHAMGQVTAVNLWHDQPDLGPGTISFGTNGIYKIDLTFSQTGISTHFTPSCLQFSGTTNIDCPLLGQQITTYYTAAAGTHPVSFQNIKCQLATDTGCDCQYDYDVELTDEGTWLATGDLVVESSTQYLLNGDPVMSQAPELSMVATYCQMDKALTMSGYNGSDLSLVGGLRTLALTRM